VVVADSSGHTTALTGTSVSSAAVAGAAAMIWSYKPNATAAQVMDILYAAGDDAGASAHYGPPGHTSEPVHALDVCSAMHGVCGSIPGCSAPAQICDGGVTATLGDIEATLDAMTPQQTQVSFATADICLGCNGALTLALSTDPLQGCPAEDPVTSFTEPQPIQPACPNCTITKKDGQGMFSASLDPYYSANNGYEVVDVMVDFDDGSTMTYYRLGDVTLDENDVYEFDLGPMMNPPLRANVSIYFELDGRALDMPQTNALIVLP
jgi:hypothetical protein